jgi:hypothetical protein
MLLDMHEISALNTAIRDDYFALRNLVVLGQYRVAVNGSWHLDDGPDSKQRG